jgi:predicted dehydrogenase
MNELVIYENAGPKAEQGFRTILSGPDHPPYGQFVPAPGHQLGFLDLKTIEAAEIARAIVSGARPHPDFDHALAYETVIHAIARSAASGERVKIDPP